MLILKVHCLDSNNDLLYIFQLPVNYPVSAMVMVIYYYVERIWRVLVTPAFLYNIYNHETYYSGEPVNTHIQSLINIIQEKNWVITRKIG